LESPNASFSASVIQYVRTRLAHQMAADAVTSEGSRATWRGSTSCFRSSRSASGRRSLGC